MKKYIWAVITAAIMCVVLLAGCAGSNQSSSSSSAQNTSTTKHKVVCATFPAYDWVCQVIGEKKGDYEITYLMESGVDLHSYQPSVQDIAKIADADLFIYVGGESDGWAEDAIKNAKSEIRTVKMIDAVGDALVEEEHVEGMQEHEHAEAAEETHGHATEDAHAHEVEHEHAHEATHEHNEAEEHEYDEHVWLSLRNAQKIVSAIGKELATIDATNADLYTSNVKSYNQQLADLDARYTKAMQSAPKDTVVFADRFPFRYLVDDYKLKYFAAFAGCSAETEASFETVAFLAKKIDELGLNSVLVIEDSDQQIAKTVIQNTNSKNKQILVMDSLQSTKDSDVKAGKTYLGAMESNLNVLSEALS